LPYVLTGPEVRTKLSRFRFVTGLRADQDTVTAGLTLRRSSGSVEGHVNRINLLHSISSYTQTECSSR
jgi:hypothetical protein